MNKQEEIKTTLENLKTTLAAAVNDDGSPILPADYDPKVMQGLITDHVNMIKGCYACLHSMANDLYNHIDSSKHLPAAKNWDHMDFMTKTLGFQKEDAIRRAAYASRKVIIG